MRLSSSAEAGPAVPVLEPRGGRAETTPVSARGDPETQAEDSQAMTRFIALSPRERLTAGRQGPSPGSTGSGVTAETRIDHGEMSVPYFTSEAIGCFDRGRSPPAPERPARQHIPRPRRGGSGSATASSRRQRLVQGCGNRAIGPEFPRPVDRADRPSNGSGRRRDRTLVSIATMSLAIATAP
jgi:hypothetical protein